VIGPDTTRSARPGDDGLLAEGEGLLADVEGLLAEDCGALVLGDGLVADAAGPPLGAADATWAWFPPPPHPHMTAMHSISTALVRRVEIGLETRMHVFEVKAA
jgi:hypothetical protein